MYVGMSMTYTPLNSTRLPDGSKRENAELTKTIIEIDEHR